MCRSAQDRIEFCLPFVMLKVHLSPGVLSSHRCRNSLLRDSGRSPKTLSVFSFAFEVVLAMHFACIRTKSVIKAIEHIKKNSKGSARRGPVKYMRP